MPKKDGFALVSVLAILVLLLVLVLSISSVLHVETQSSASGKNHVIARQNALLGLQTAMSQLQEYAGKDQAVTFPATTFYPTKNVNLPDKPAPRTGKGEIFDNAIYGFRAKAMTSNSTGDSTYLTPAERSNWDTALKGYWNANRNPHWLGIMDTSLRVDQASNPTSNPTPLSAQPYETLGAGTKFGEPKRDQLPIWLVSGNEKFTIDQNTDTAYPAGYYTPDTSLPDPATDLSIVYLVGLGSATDNSTSSDGIDGRVKVKKQEVKTADASGTNQVTGHYAYWVGDESTKANFAVRDPYFTASQGTVDYRNRLQVPQRVGWENVTGFGNATFDINDPKLENISTSKEIGLLEDTNTQAIKDAAKANFHSLTAFSKTLLTDTALGGLKKDLTVFLEGSSSIVAADPIFDRSRYVSTDPRFGSGNLGFPAVAGATGLPTWGQVKSWYHNAGGSASTVSVEPGRSPVLANYQLFFAITHSGDRLQFHIVPMIALWNPYDVSLASATYTLKWRHNFIMAKFGVAVRNDAYVDPTPKTSNAPDTPNDADGRKMGNYFISPLTGFGWHASGQKIYGTSFTSLWGNSTATTSSPAYTSPNYVFAPFDTGTATGSTPVLPTSSDATWVPYRFTASFAPGEVKIFTVDGMQQVNASQLHAGTGFVALTNDFDPDTPSSYYFDFASGLSKGLGEQAVTASDDVRWYGEVLNTGGSKNLNSMELLLGNQSLWRTYFTGASGSWGANLVNTTNPSSRIDPENPSGGGPIISSSINWNAPWRQAYDLSAWPGIAKGQKFSRDVDSSIIGMFRGRLDPFKLSPGSLFNTYIQNDGLNKYYRGFANYNLAALSQDPLPEIELARDVASSNNRDRFSNFSPILVDPNSTNMKWDEDQVDFSSGSARGFTLFGWKNLDAVSNPTKGISTIPLRQFRRADSALLSLGQLQQVNLSPNFWQPSFPLGNSEASPYVDRSRIAGLQSYPVESATNTIYMIWQAIRPVGSVTFPNDAQNRFLDLSYLLNENIWDSYFLSTIPQSGGLSLDNTSPLPNSRHRFNGVGGLTTGDVRSFESASAYLENVGALNVNTTSVEPWKALLTAFRNLTIQGAGSSNPANTVPISRTLTPSSGPIDFTNATRNQTDYGANTSGSRDYSKMFLGFRYLTDVQITRLAERIVDEVRLRGPFLSLADFVNRRLVSPDLSSGSWASARTINPRPGSGTGNSISNTDAIGSAYDAFLGLSGINGALQRAINVSGINGGMNYPFTPDDATGQSDRVFRVDKVLSDGLTGQPMQVISSGANYLDTEHRAGMPAGEMGQLLSHAPGFITQGDLLAMIGPALTPRGDTFLVRTYGDAIDKNGRVLARAYLEAVVQRVPDPVTPAGTSGASKWRYTDKFGRKFKVVKLRWLNPEEV